MTGRYQALYLSPRLGIAFRSGTQRREPNRRRWRNAAGSTERTRKRANRCEAVPCGFGSRRGNTDGLATERGRA